LYWKIKASRAWSRSNARRNVAQMTLFQHSIKADWKLIWRVRLLERRIEYWEVFGAPDLLCWRNFMMKMVLIEELKLGTMICN
jgi:hypothetical protein